MHYMRIWDTRTSNGVDYFIANSHFIAKRIWKCYRRKATVIYPPVDIEKFEYCEDKDDYYVTASRMVPYKKMDLIVEAFSQMPDKRLVVIGDGPDFEKIKKKAGTNISLLGFASDEVLKDKIQHAKAFVFAAEEDFGILPVEAQACGTPVIAYGRGGALETVRAIGRDSQPTGVFFKEQTGDSLKAAIEKFEDNSSNIFPESCRKNAEQFSIDVFQTRFKKFFKEALATDRSIFYE